MEKREINKDNEVRKERFEFILSVNDNIICQRFFKINGFNELSLWSMDLKQAVDQIVDMIDDDLKSKSRVYTHYMYNPNYDDEEFQVKEFSGVGEKHSFIPKEGTEYVIGKPHYDRPKDVDGVKTYLYNPESVFKFEFIVDGQPRISKIWSGDNYPSVIRNSVDITNKRYNYEDVDERRMTFDAFLNYKMSKGKVDLVPLIIKRLCDSCSNKSYYDTKTVYSDTLYNVRFNYDGNSTDKKDATIVYYSYNTKNERNKRK